MIKVVLNDDLECDSLIDEQGYPVEMDPVEREAIEEAEFEESLQRAVAENQAFLALGGMI